MDAIECIMTRRSCRSYKAEMPEEKKIETVIEAARYAPSGMSRQSWHFTVVTNEDWLRRMNERVYKLVNDQSKGSNLDRNGAKGYSCNYHSPVFVIVSADPAYGTSAGDCACALENMFLAAHAVHDVGDRDRLDAQLLGLDLGKAAGGIGYKREHRWSPPIARNLS